MEKPLNIAAFHTFYKGRPDEFAERFLGIKLKWYQKVFLIFA